MNRRNFLKLAGASLLSIPAIGLFKEDTARYLSEINAENRRPTKKGIESLARSIQETRELMAAEILNNAYTHKTYSMRFKVTSSDPLFRQFK